jgi:hypothetical protein
VSSDVDFLSACKIWAPADWDIGVHGTINYERLMSLSDAKIQLNQQKLDIGTRIRVDDDGMIERDVSYWYPFDVGKAKGARMELDHYFECRFAGRLILGTCTLSESAEDPTCSHTITLLDRIINHEANLAWVTDDINARKNNYFSGKPAKS